MIADTARFSRDLAASRGIAAQAANAIKGSLTSIDGAVKAMIGSMLSFRGVIATVLGTGGLGLLVRNAITAGDRIAEMAQRIGVSTDALQELSHAAQLSGASVEDLENGLRFLNKNLGDAQAGGKAAAEAFRKIGIDASQFRNAGDAIGAVADGILTLGNEAQRTEARLEILGRGGNQLAILLNEGSEGIARMREEARRLGLVIDREMLKHAQKLADDFDRLAAVIKTNLTTSMLALAPVLLATAEKLAALSAAVAPMLTHFLVPDSVLLSQQQLKDRIAQVNLALHDANTVIQSGAAFRAGQQAQTLEEIKLLEVRKKLLEETLQTRKKLDAAADVRTTVAGGGASAGITPDQVKAVEDFRQKLVSLAIPDETAKRLVELQVQANKLKDTAPGLAAEIQKIANAMAAIIAQSAAADAVKKVAEAEEKLSKQRAAQEAAFLSEVQAVTDAFNDQQVQEVYRRFEEEAKAREQHNAGEVARIDAQIAEEERLDEMLRKIDDDRRKAQDKVTENSNKLIASLQAQVDAFGMTERAAFVYNEQLKLGSDATAAMTAETAALAGQLYDLKQAQAESNKLVSDATNVVLNTTLSVSDALIDMALTGKANFKELAESIVRDMGRIIAKMLIIKAIEMTIAAFSGTSSSLGTTEQLSGPGVTVPAGATGGVVKHRPGGRLIIAGEKDDEAIIPLDRMGELGGGGVTVVNEIHNHTDAKVTTQQQQMPDGRLINRIIIQAVKDGIASGEFENEGKAAYGWKRQGVNR